MIDEDIQEANEKAYAELAKLYPQLMAGTRLFGGGGTSIVVEGPRDGVLTKIFSRLDAGERWEDGNRLARNEAKILRLLEDRMPAGLQVPKIIDDRITEKGKRLSFAFRMTKLPGEKIDWDDLIDEPDDRKIQQHLYSAGAALGKLHHAMEGITRKQLPDIIKNNQDMHRFDRIKAITRLGDDWNRALEKLDRYLVKNAPRGVVHKDFNHANFLVDENQHVTGVFDFAYAYYSANRYVDVVDAKLFLPESNWRDYLKGYSSQISVNSDALMGAEIAHECSVIELDTDDWSSEGAKIFHSKMSALSHVTGFTPPPLSVLQGGPK